MILPLWAPPPFSLLSSPRPPRPSQARGQLKPKGRAPTTGEEEAEGERACRRRGGGRRGAHLPPVRRPKGSALAAGKEEVEGAEAPPPRLCLEGDATGDSTLLCHRPGLGERGGRPSPLPQAPSSPSSSSRDKSLVRRREKDATAGPQRWRRDGSWERRQDAGRGRGRVTSMPGNH